jgi:hypothetical protein
MPKTKKLYQVTSTRWGGEPTEAEGVVVSTGEVFYFYHRGLWASLTIASPSSLVGEDDATVAEFRQRLYGENEGVMTQKQAIDLIDRWIKAYTKTHQPQP